MSLKSLVHQKIINDVFRSVKKKGEWKVLVLDQLGMKIVSSCCTLRELVEERVTLVESLLKNREPLPSMDAIYFITPTDKSIHLLIQDFSSIRNILYRNAHIFFTDTCPDELFNKLCQSECAKFIKTLKEVNIAFMPYESQVFSLEAYEVFQSCYNVVKKSSRSVILERIAQQIASVCVTLGEYPKIRYRVNFEVNIELAKLIKTKLDAYKTDYQKMGDEPEKEKSQLIILDRGFDCITPIVHELTFQAMVYDVLPVENDVLKKSTTDGEKIILLDQSDNWCELKFAHIADVLPIVTSSLKKSTRNKRMITDENTNIKQFSLHLKMLPEHQKELKKHLACFHLAEDCMSAFKDNVNVLCKVEQDLVMGIDDEEEKTRDPFFNIVSILLDPSVRIFNKIRIILLYILSKNGVSEENLSRLVERAEIPIDDKCIVTNMANLGATIISDSNRKKMHQISRRDRLCDKTYQLSRWTPVLKDVIEDAVDDKLDEKCFQFLGSRIPARTLERQKPKSVRYGHKQTDKKTTNTKNVSRLIVFVLGGMTYSEIRCCYEVTKDVKNINNWELLIGSDRILTPDIFLRQLQKLSCESV